MNHNVVTEQRLIHKYPLKHDAFLKTTTSG